MPKGGNYYGRGYSSGARPQGNMMQNMNGPLKRPNQMPRYPPQKRPNIYRPEYRPSRPSYSAKIETQPYERPNISTKVEAIPLIRTKSELEVKEIETNQANNPLINITAARIDKPEATRSDGSNKNNDNNVANNNLNVHKTSINASNNSSKASSTINSDSPNTESGGNEDGTLTNNASGDSSNCLSQIECEQNELADDSTINGISSNNEAVKTINETELLPFSIPDNIDMETITSTVHERFTMLISKSQNYKKLNSLLSECQAKLKTEQNAMKLKSIELDKMINNIPC